MCSDRLDEASRQAMSSVLTTIALARTASDELSRTQFQCQCSLDRAPKESVERAELESLVRTLGEARDSYADILRKAHEAIVALDALY